MSDQLATKKWISDNIDTVLGWQNDNQLASKSAINTADSGMVIDGSYTDNQIVKQSDISKMEITYEYSLTVTPNTLTFATGGGTQNVSVSAIRRATINGVPDIAWSTVPYDIQLTGDSAFTTNLLGTSLRSITATVNNTTSVRTATLKITIPESGDQATVAIKQNANVTISPSTVFNTMLLPNTGSSYATTVTVAGFTSQPTITVVMSTSTNWNHTQIARPMGSVNVTAAVAAGTGTWTFSIYPSTWYQAMIPSDTTVHYLPPGYICEGTVTITDGVNSTYLYINGRIFDNWIVP